MSIPTSHRRPRLAFGVALATLLVTLGYGLWLASSASSVREPELDVLESPTRESTALVSPAQESSALEAVRDAQAAVPQTEEGKEDLATSEPSDFLVQVVDYQDRVLRDVDVAIAASFHSGGGGSSRSSIGIYRCTEGSADPFLRIPRADVVSAFQKARENARNRPSQTAIEIAFECDLKSVETTRHILSENEAPSGPIRLRVSPAGRVRVEVIDAGGNLMSQPLDVSLECLAAGETPRARVLRARVRNLNAAYQQTIEGRAFFPYVKVGRRLDIVVTDRNEVLAPQRVLAEGPLGPTHEALVQVSVGRTNPLLIGTLVDDTGVPIGSSEIFFFATHGDVRNGMKLRTDERGRFELRWSWPLRQGRAPERFSLHLLSLGETESSADAPSALLLAPSIPEEGTLDLGTITLRKPEPGRSLAAGIVVDGKGQPLPKATLDCYALWPIAAQGPYEEYRRLSGDGVPHVTDAEGRFRLQSSEPCRGLRIDAHLDGYFLQRPEICEVGREDLRLVLLRGATLAGTVLLDEGVDRSGLQVIFTDEQHEETESSIDARGAFELRGLRPGIGRLSVGPMTWPFIRIDEIAVIDGEETVRDPRVAIIDLRGKLRRWPLKIVTGEPLEGLRMGLLSDGEGGERFTALPLDREGRVAPWIPVGVPSVLVALAGCEPALLRYAAEEQIVNLSPGRKIRFDLSRDIELPEGLVLAVSLGFPGDARPSPLQQSLSSQGSVDVSRERTAILRVGAPGRYLLRWRLRSRFNGRSVSISEEPLDVASEPREPSFRIAPPADALARALERLR